MKSSKWIHLGMLFDEEDERFLIETNKNVLTAAGSKFQWNLIDGIEANTGEAVNIINSLPVETWPKNGRKLLIRKRKWTHNGISKNVNVPCINIKVLKQITRFCGVSYELLKRTIAPDEVIVTLYHFNLYIIFAALLVRRIRKIRLCLIVPDLPNEFGIKGDKSFLSKLLGKIYLSLASKMDMCVLLTKHMANVLKLNSSQYIVIEGFADIKEAAEDNCYNSTKKIILYSGNICKECNIPELIDAFKRIKGEYELHLYGFGELKEFCKIESKHDNRIIVHEICKRSDMIEAQRQAYILINPRNRKDGISKYFFPSKTFEYMLSGRPMVGYALDSIPKEYEDYYYVISEKNDGLYECLRDVLSYPEEELKKKGSKAKDFVVNNKNNIIQVKKIVEFISKNKET